MSPAELKLDESFTSWLAACDEMLAAGLKPHTLDEVGLEPALQSRVQRGVSCLERLQELWPSTDDAENALALPVTEPFLTRLGKFELKKELGRGGFGVVYLAHDTQLRRDVALKIPRLDVLLTPDLRARLEHEAQAAARLDHPLIVPVYEAGAVGIVSYIATAYCPGITLAQWQAEQKKPIPPAEAAQLVAQLAEAVHHAHSRGVLHRDLKPANVLVTESTRRQGDAETRGEDDPHAVAASPRPRVSASLSPKITDFGLAKVLPEAGKDAPSSNMIAGTASYMAPEQAEGRTKEIGTAADVYGLGAILYELLTGRPPFRAEGMLATLEQVRRLEPSAPRRLRADVPADLQTICLKCLQKEPARRYGSAAALGEDLGRFLRGEPISARPVGVPERLAKWVRRHPAWATLVGVILTTLVAGALVLNQQRNEAFKQRQQMRAALRELIAGAEQLLAPADGLDLRPGLPPGRPFHQVQQLYDQLGSAPENIQDPSLRHELARMLRLMGEIYHRLKEPDRAATAHERAVSLLDSLLAEFPGDRTYRLDLALTLSQQAEADTDAWKKDACLQRSCTLLAELAAAHPDQPAFLAEHSRAMLRRARLHIEKDPSTFERLAGEARILQEGMVERYPQYPSFLKDLRITYQEFIGFYQKRSRPDDAARIAQRLAALPKEQ